MKVFLTGFLILIFFSVPIFIGAPALAQENAEAVTGNGDTPAMVEDTDDKAIKAIAEPQEENYAQRLELSKDMHKIWPIRPKVEAAIDAVGAQVPPVERAKFKAAMRRAMKFKALEEASIEAMAEIFTVAELKKMIEFYSSKEGRSVSYKTGDYEKALQPLMVKMIDKAILDTRLGEQ